MPAGRETPILVAISGIDAAGKGTLAKLVAERLRATGMAVAVVGLDDWHEPSRAWRAAADPAEAFYRGGFLFDAMFDEGVEPHRREGAVDVIVLEGIFLFKREHRDRYDLTIWLECPFDVALRRAILRNQEGLTEAELISDYETVYFPAQRIHHERDDPRSFADEVVIVG